MILTDILKRSTAAAVKAIGRRREMEVAFASAPLSNSVAVQEKRVSLPEPPEEMGAADIAALRGAADSAALRLRYHDSFLFFASSPRMRGSRATETEADQTTLDARLRGHDTAKDILASLEIARCEALGARQMVGVRGNLAAFLDLQCQQKGLDKAKSRADAPLADVLRLVAFEKLSGGVAPLAAQKALALWQAELDEKVEPFWPLLAEKLGDQAVFAEEAQKFIHALTFGEILEETKKSKPSPQEKAEEKTPSAPDEDDKEGSFAKESGGAGDEEKEGKASFGGTAQEGEEKGEASDQNPVLMDERAGPVTTYRIFTKAFDETVKASTLCSPAELVRLRRLLDRQMKPLASAVLRLANKLQRRLLARQRRNWDFDQEEGLLDASRLPRIIVNPLEPLSYKVEKESDFRDTVVSLLIDNSGSMRGRPMMLAAMSADILARTLERCGVKTEVLGFTTRAWKGGRAREAWVEKGKPARPGRLNEVRHILYKEADVPWRRGHTALGLMLREGLLKENIDGEALLWAHERLRRRPEKRRILMVISDGAPVDDSTLSANPSDYLEAHLRSVVDWIERRGAVELSAIGIGHDVTRIYKRAITISDAEQLSGAMVEQLAALFER